MCEFVSWIETNELDNNSQPKIYFLTGKQVYHTEKGKKLQEWTKSSDDLVGHGAIRFFWGMEQEEGLNRECIDFGSPDNFPEGIVKAIKRGDMQGFISETALKLLTPDALKIYAEREKAYAERVKAYAERVKADAQWKKAEIENGIFWDLFSIPNNRNSLWR